MALTTPKGFSGGPMADIDYGYSGAPSAWCEQVGGQLAVTQPVTGTRSVSIADGRSTAFGIRVINDAALSQAVAAPGSGGAWYLIAIRRDWSAKAATLQVLAGPSTGSTTAPTAPPATLPATMVLTPGTTYDQPLAWVWASSAVTNLTIFDMRMLDNGAKGVTAANLWALVMARVMGLLLIGTTVSVAQYAIPGGGDHFRSLWTVARDGVTGTAQLLSVGRIVGSEYGGTYLRDHIKAVVAGYTGAIVLQGSESEVHDQFIGTTYRWNGTDLRPWDSGWITPNGGFPTIGFQLTYSVARWRYRSGRVLMEFAGTSGGPTAQGGMGITLPVTAQGLAIGGVSFNRPSYGGIIAYPNTLTDANSVYFSIVQTASGASPRGGNMQYTVDVIGAGSAIAGSLEYTPANGF